MGVDSWVTHEDPGTEARREQGARPDRRRRNPPHPPEHAGLALPPDHGAGADGLRHREEARRLRRRADRGDPGGLQDAGHEAQHPGDPGRGQGGRDPGRVGRRLRVRDVRVQDAPAARLHPPAGRRVHRTVLDLGTRLRNAVRPRSRRRHAGGGGPPPQGDGRPADQRGGAEAAVRSADPRAEGRAAGPAQVHERGFRVPKQRRRDRDLPPVDEPTYYDLGETSAQIASLDHPPNGPR